MLMHVYLRKHAIINFCLFLWNNIYMKIYCNGFLITIHGSYFFQFSRPVELTFKFNASKIVWKLNS